MEQDPAPAWAVARYSEGSEESRLEAVPELLGMGSHLLLVARRPESPG